MVNTQHAAGYILILSNENIFEITNCWNKLCVKDVSTVAADGLAPSGARPSAVTVMIKSCPYMYRLSP